MNVASKAFRYIFPAPWISLGIFFMWLVLNHAMDVPAMVMAALLALFIPQLVKSLRPTHVRVLHLGEALRLFMLVGYDSVVSNLSVAKGLLRLRSRHLPEGCFVVIPLELRAPAGLAALAAITTVIPGTVWCEISLDRTAMLLHVFDLHTDVQSYIAYFKNRYEKPLMEIFE